MKVRDVWKKLDMVHQSGWEKDSLMSAMKKEVRLKYDEGGELPPHGNQVKEVLIERKTMKLIRKENERLCEAQHEGTFMAL